MAGNGILLINSHSHSSHATEVYIVGNHEHYHGDFKDTIPHLKEKLKYLPNLQILDKEVWTLHDEVTFIGILTRDNPPTAEAFQRRLGIPYPTLIDDSILLGFKGSLAANAIPSTVVIDREGRVAARISGEVTVASLSQLIESVSAE